ncbi:TCR beta variable region [Triplophysa rosa]|nr:TCR beta variable region [Triplophysa rosa]
MTSVIIITIIPTFWLTVCVVSSPIIQQSPEHLLVTVDQKEAMLHCRHGDNDYPYMYWYQQNSSGGSLELIGMLQYSEPTHLKTRFSIKGHAKEDAFLSIFNISSEDRAVYYCAASRHSRTVFHNP